MLSSKATRIRLACAHGEADHLLPRRFCVTIQIIFIFFTFDIKAA
jgi:hypothetical protein